MTKKEILDAIHGQMIISCQAVEGEPLYAEEKGKQENGTDNTAFGSFRLQTTDPFYNTVNSYDDLYIHLWCS